jgi:hypothetical protein
MTFRDTQLGRFGELCTATFSLHVDPDLRAAHALAHDGAANGNRPSLQDVLDSKMLLEDADPAWQKWAPRFSSVVSHYQSLGGGPLAARCTRSWLTTPAGFCMHELTPPLQYWSMRSFAANQMNRGNLFQKANGSLAVDPSVKPLWNYVITHRGEILVASEDFGWIKHTSIAGGQNVWAAGQVGIENQQLRLVDLQSGHYVGGLNLNPNSSLANELMLFTERAFKEYFQAFALSNIHPSFGCIWA